MSAIEQPALRSGRITFWWSPVSTSADSAMKCTPQNTMNSASVLLLGEHREAVAVAAGVGPADHLVALVVVAEDEDAIAEGRLGGARCGRRARTGVRRCSARRGGSGASTCCGCPPRWVPVAGRRGQPGRLSRGDVVPGTDMSPDTGPARCSVAACRPHRRSCDAAPGASAIAGRARVHGAGSALVAVARSQRAVRGDRRAAMPTATELAARDAPTVEVDGASSASPARSTRRHGASARQRERCDARPARRRVGRPSCSGRRTTGAAAQAPVDVDRAPTRGRRAAVGGDPATAPCAARRRRAVRRSARAAMAATADATGDRGRDAHVPCVAASRRRRGERPPTCRRDARPMAADASRRGRRRSRPALRSSRRPGRPMPSADGVERLAAVQPARRCRARRRDGATSAGAVRARRSRQPHASGRRPRGRLERPTPAVAGARGCASAATSRAPVLDASTHDRRGRAPALAAAATRWPATTPGDGRPSRLDASAGRRADGSRRCRATPIAAMPRPGRRRSRRRSGGRASAAADVAARAPRRVAGPIGPADVVADGRRLPPVELPTVATARPVDAATGSTRDRRSGRSDDRRIVQVASGSSRRRLDGRRATRHGARAAGRRRDRRQLRADSVSSDRWCSARPPARSPTPRAPTSSRTRTGASSTSARPSRCGRGCQQLLREGVVAAAPHGVDGGGGRDGRVDPGPQRRRGADAGEHAHQEPPAALQRAAARRQELPVPRRHDGRRVAPADGDAGPQAQGRPLLRALRPRLRHPGDARPAAAHLPAAHLLGQQVQPAPAPRPALPAVPHREVLRALRGRGRPRRSTTQHVEALLQFLDGDTDSVVQELETRMHEAAGELEFEQAARLRDRLTSVQKAIEKQQMVAERSEDFDVLGIADDELEAAVQVFFVRKGRVVGRKGFIVDKVEDLTPAELVSNVVERLYDDPPQGIPKTVLVPGRRRRPAALRGVADARSAARRSPSGCRSGARSASSRRPSPATPARSSSATGCAGRPTTTAGPRRSTSCRSTSACPRPRCGSSATT